MIANHRDKLNIFQITNIFNVAFRSEFNKLSAEIEKKLAVLETVGCQHARMFFDIGGYYDLLVARDFMHYELVEDNLRDLQTIFLKRHFEEFMNQSAEQIKQTAARIMKAMGALIINRTVVQYEDLLYIDFKHLLADPAAEIKHYHHMQDELHDYLKSHSKRTSQVPDALERCGNKQMRTSRMNDEDYEDYLKREFDQHCVPLKPR